MKFKNTLQFVPIEREKDLCHFHQEDGYSFPDETFVGLASLCTILREIHDRLIHEGYSIIHREVKEPFEVNCDEQNITQQ